MIIETESAVANRPQGYRPFIQICLFLCIITGLYFSSIAPLFSRWMQLDQDLSHGLPTIAVFLFLLWRALPWTYKADSAGIRVLFLALLALTSVAWFLFYKINIAILAYLSILLIIILFIATCYSKKTALHLLIPCGVLIFAIPLWGDLNVPLVELSSYVVGELGKLAGITLLLDGNNIFLPFGRLYIDDGCSGLRYLLISLLMAYLVSHFNHYRLKNTVIAFSVAIILALLTNWIRIFVLVVVGYETEMTSGLLKDHELFGWLLFSFVMLPAIYFAPAYKPTATNSGQLNPVAKPWLPVIALAIGPLLVFFAQVTPVAAPVYTLDNLENAAPETESSAFFDVVFPKKPRVSEKLITRNGFLIKIELAQFQQTDPREKLVPYFRSLYNRDHWLVASESDDDALSVHFSVLKRAGNAEHSVLAYTFQVGRYATDRYGVAKLLQIPAMLLGDNYFIIFTAHASCRNSLCEGEKRAIKEVIRHWKMDPIAAQ